MDEEAPYTDSLSPFPAALHRVERTVPPERAFLAAPNHATLTYGALFDCTRRLAAFHYFNGIGPGACVVIASPDQRHVLAALATLLRIGVTAVIADPEMPATDLRALVRAAGARGLLIDPELPGGVAVAGGLPRGGALLHLCGGTEPGGWFPRLFGHHAANDTVPTLGDVVCGYDPIRDLPDELPEDTVALLRWTLEEELFRCTPVTHGELVDRLEEPGDPVEEALAALLEGGTPVPDPRAGWMRLQRADPGRDEAFPA